MANNKRVKISGYAKRIFFNDNIEYRNFSPDLVGFQLTSNGGTSLFTNGNFSISVNLEPKPNILFTQGVKSKFYTLDDIVTSGNTELDIQKNVKTKLNIDLTNPLSYIWYGSMNELIRASLLEIQDNWPAAIYVDNKVGSVTGNNITDYVYDIASDESTFKVNSNFFVNPYNIKYTSDSVYLPNNGVENPLRNFSIKYSSYVIEHNGIVRKIKNITPAPQKTNSEITLVVEGNPFPELTGIFIPQFSFLSNNIDASIPYFIKPNESELEKFFTSLNDFQRTILNRNIFPKYRAEIISSDYTDDGVLLTSKEVYDFPVLEDGYNLNFFDISYISFLNSLTQLGDGLDSTNTDIIIRKYTTEAINSFDTIPRGDGNDLVLNGEKATKLLRIYGVEFDYIKKYINGIKFAHVVTYNKNNNIPDSLIKDLSFMLGLEPINFLGESSLSKLYLPSNGSGQFSGTSTNLTQEQIDIELYRRLILNIAWLWKSKGSRKAVEFLFKFIGAPELLVNFNEYVVLVDKPLDIQKIKSLLYLYTGEVNLNNVPYDDNGFPLPPINGELVISNFIDPETGNVVENGTTEMYFQKAGGWYRETYGNNVITQLEGNNPHVGPYDGGSEYLQYFSKCYIPNFDNEPSVVVTAQTILQNYFLNYNYGIFNGVSSATTDFYTTQLTFNNLTGQYQPIDNCLDVEYSIIETPLQNDGKTTLQQAFTQAEEEYNNFLQQIQQNNYLVYSTEWQIIKNNYELSLNNCLNEIATENCDINQTMQICLGEPNKDTIEFSCDNLGLNSCSPFYYYTNSDGIKISFDNFPSCCRQIDPKNQFVSFINEQGRIVEYCSSKAPCIGNPVEVLDDGIVVFDITSNSLSDNRKKNTINLNTVNDTSEYDGKQYYYEGNCYRLKTEDEFTLKQLEALGVEPEQYINVITNQKGDRSYNLYSRLFSTLFTLVDCNNKTIISSPECCAWYGFDYQIVTVEDKCFIACVQKENEDSCIKNSFIEQPLLPAENNSYEYYTIPYIDYSVNNNYVELQNPVGATQQYYSTEVYTECFEESIIIKGFAGGTPLSPLPYSLFEDPEFMEPSNWVVYSIDQYGRVSFTPSSFESDFILDWNYSDPQLNDLYELIAIELEYNFGTFTFDYNNNVLVPYDGTNGNISFMAAVDPNYVTCNNLNSVSVVFASENWKGFKLPELEDCSCTIDFSFDYMVKYNAEDLIRCADNESCFPAIINNNTLQNYNCLNFVVFTNSSEESGILETTFNSSDTDNSENIEIWQNTNILEPDNECCIAIGGNLVSKTQWNNLNQQWINTIDENYIGLSNFTTDFIESIDYSYSEYISYINTYENTVTQLSTLPTECFEFDLTLFDCDIDYSCYLQTQNVCSLQIPIECGLWTKIYHNYVKLHSEIERNIELYQQYLKACDTKRPIEEIINIRPQILINSTKRDSIGGINDIKNDSDKIESQIIKSKGEVTQKTNDNVIIQKSLTNVNVPLDCTVYETKLVELRNFNYNTYCNSIVYGSPNINDGTKNEEFNSCIKSKTLENQNEIILYSNLLQNCQLENSLNEQIKTAKFDNNQKLVGVLETQLSDVKNEINKLTTDYNNSVSYDESQKKSDLENNDIQNTINRTAELLNTTPSDITDSSGNLNLTDTQKISLNIILNKNISQINDLQRKIDDNESLLEENRQKALLIDITTEELIDTIKDENDLVETDCGTLVVDTNDSNPVINCCEETYIGLLKEKFLEIEGYINTLKDLMEGCHQSWYESLLQNYNDYEIENNTYFSKYLDDLKINFKLFVDNNDIVVQNNIDTSLTYLPYTQSINPIWEWDPTNGYTGIFLDGDEQLITTIKEGVFNYLSLQNISYNSDIFEPDWKTFNFTIPECVCDDLRRLYPNKEFFFSIEVENYECKLCLLVDNIQVNVADCQTNRILSLNDCMIPQLSCVIDNKKSWVYYEDGVIKETIYPNGKCNSGSTSNFEIIKLGKEQERLWLDLEYRYTDYNINHSDLLINVKNTTFSIDPAKAIECDVFNYWKNIDCDNCPTKCMEDSKTFEDNDDFLFQDCNTYIFEDQSTLHSVVFSGEVINSGYTLSFEDITTTGLIFSCSTYTDILQQQVVELKNKYYSLTSNYVESLDSTYYDLLEKGEELSKFYVQKNNCGTDTLVINDDSSLNNLFGIITENYDGTISIFETYLYTGLTPYSGGMLMEVLSGVTAQTFNQKLDIDQQCCESLNELLNGNGVNGLGLGKNYQWDSGNCFCTWKPFDGCYNCKGDCEYCGEKKVCVDGFETGDTYNVCINPLDYLDIHPSEINIKAVFDQLVQTNLIDVKSRQTISDYPLLRLFYELYLNANNCGKHLSGKFTYDTMFEFMDKIGDYWLDLLEQVVPATTIWEGCDNSGKIYRNTIFDQNKFKYKRYSLNFIDVENDCPLSAQTEYSIGSNNIYSLVEQKPIYPTNVEIVNLKNDILQKGVEISLLEKQISVESNRLCSLNLQDLNTPNLQNTIDSQQDVIDLLNGQLSTLNQESIDLNNELTELELEYLQQQKNYYMNFMSCTGITQTLIKAEQNLSGFTQGTTSYERQRNFIAVLRDKYTKCVRQSNTLISDYNTVFITQIYDSNEYEGNVTIIGDPDWEDGGPFYNQELIHNC
jgi:hypothetical protein